MVKLHLSYLKKVPGNQEYSSEQLFAGLEAEFHDDIIFDFSLLQERSKELFEELRKAVELQAKTLQPRAQSTRPIVRAYSQNRQPWTNRGASQKQDGKSGG